METLSFAEELLLLVFDDDTGRARPLPEKGLACAMAGAALLELAFAGRLDNDAEAVTVLDDGPTGDPHLDEALACLPAPGEKLTLGQALAQVSLAAARLVDGTAERLVGAGLLERRGGGFLPKAGREEVHGLRRRVREAVLSDDVPSPRAVVTVGLLDACGLAPWLFSADELARRAGRLRQVARLELLVQAMAEAIRAFEGASADAVAADVARSRYVAPRSVAGGKDAVVSALAHVHGEAGFLRGSLLLTKVNQPGGFDCPGCAWPEPEKGASLLEFCENGAKTIAAEATRRRAGPAFFARTTLAAMAAQSDHWLERQGRLVRPMLRRKGADRYEPVSWDDALGLLGAELRRLDSPDEAVFYLSGRASNETAFLLQLLARRLGTNNLAGSADLCHRPSALGLDEAFGGAKGTVTLSDLEQADAILLFGHNPGSNHPRMLTALETAARRGARLVAINPLPEASLLSFSNPHEVRGLLGGSTSLASLHVPVRVGGDLALVKGIVKAVLEEEARRPGEVLDRAFLESFTTGLAEVAASAEKASREELSRLSGVPWPLVEEVARIYVGARRVVASWGLGVTQHRQGTATVREILNLLLLRGNVGRPGTGACPMRGHSNVQGHATMGVTPTPSARLLDALERELGFAPPRRPGLGAAAALRAMHEGRVKVLVSLGGNLAASAPDSAFTAEALSRCRLTAVVATTLNRSAAVTGETALLLPCLGRTEVDFRDGRPQVSSVEDAMGRVHATRGCAPPASPDLAAESWIVARLAREALGPSDALPWELLANDVPAVRGLIARVVPGFERFEERLPRGFTLPIPARERRFGGPDGKARFTVQEPEPLPVGAGELLLTDVRSHDQFNTAVYGLDDRYRGVRRERNVLFMNRTDMEERGLAPEQAVVVTATSLGREIASRPLHAVPYDLPRGCVAAYFPEANAVVPAGVVDEASGTPAYKSVVVTVRPLGKAAGGAGR